MFCFINRSEDWRSPLALTLRIAFVLFCSQAAFAGEGVEAVLRRARLVSPPPDLTILYDDTSTFHGGTAIEIHGDGRILRWDTQPHQTAIAVQNESRMTPRELADLLDLLIELGAWRDDAKEQRPIPDESFRRLVITQGAERSFAREPYNLLLSGRIGKIHARLERAISQGRDLCLMPGRARPEYLRPGPIKTCDGPG